ncbi:MAG: hypothetical protein U1F66_00330 [bacterium]
MPTPLPQLEQMTDILDLKDIHPWDLRWLWALAASFVLIVVFLLLRSLWKRPRKAKAAPAPPLTPLEAALKKLDELVQSRLVESGQVRRFYFGLSDLFREFIERELEIPACEATLEELRPKLRASPWLDSEQSREAIGLLELADMAKFAQFVPPREEIVNSVKRCRAWVTQTAERHQLAAAQSQAAKEGAA